MEKESYLYQIPFKKDLQILCIISLASWSLNSV